MKWRVLLAAVVPGLWAVGGLFSMTFGTNLNWPDYVHVNYGFPLTFATHTLNTIAGPVDKWGMDMWSLTLDLAFWFAGMLLVLLLVDFANRRQGPANLTARVG